MSISLTGTSSLYTGWVPAQYRNPTSDGGYFLATADSSNTPGITINFSSAIKDFAMYWGSVDSWNTITFTDTNNIPHSFTGANLPSFNSFDPQGNNTSSILAHFSVPSGGKPWTKVTFTSCDSSGVCKPTFEFDNLEWMVAPSGCCSSTPGNTPTPEPSGLLWLGTGIAGIAARLRRTLRT
jgi:hypothetical protein